MKLRNSSVFLFAFSLLFSSTISCKQRFYLRSDVENLVVTDAKFNAGKLNLLIANKTDFKTILLLEGIACFGKEPGDKADEPGENCQEIYIGRLFPFNQAEWSDEIPLNLSDFSLPIHVRVLKVQTIEEN